MNIAADGKPQAPHQVWTLVLASLGLFMVALDTLVVTTALPVLRTDLHANLSDLEWTVNAYNLSFACFLLTHDCTCLICSLVASFTTSRSPLRVIAR